LGPSAPSWLAQAWEEQKAIKEVMVFLQGVGVSTSLAVRIYKQYRDAAISVVRSEPYQLAEDVWGIGFKTADTIAAVVGIAHDSPDRIKAGLQYTLSEAADDGHCFLPGPNLVTEAAKILDVVPEMIIPCLDELAASDGVIREAIMLAGREVPAVYLVPFHRAECSLASGLLELLHAGPDGMAALGHLNWDRALAWLGGRTGAQLAPVAGRSQSPARRLPASRPACAGSSRSRRSPRRGG
jgi:exodeoxyribonuclease V alpha subunit